MKTIWSFDLGKASIGEAVREVNKPQFIHKASLLIPPDLAQRGPATMSGTPASKHRALKTREAHWRREAWLDELWQAAELTPLARRAVAPTGGEWHAYAKRVRGKEKIKTRHTNAEWKLVQKGDPKLEREFAATGDGTCFTSCLLRIKLLNPKTLGPDEMLAEWQIYKALFSAMQKRGYGDVPWKEQRKGGADETKNVQEQAEDALAGKRWQDFVAELEKAGLGDDYRRACYFDAFYMKLWSPSALDAVALHPADRPESTRKVVFPASVIEAEIFALAQNAAGLLKVNLEAGYTAQMKKYRASVEERIIRANAYRAQHGKKLVAAPDFSRGAKDFAELLVYGPGGKPSLAKGVRPIASADPAIRRATGLRPGSPDDRMGVVSQGTARFENRLRSDCALIPRLSCCRNLGGDEFAKITDDNEPRLLPAQVTLLMKLKNMRVQEKTEGRPQRGLKFDEIEKVFAALNPKRKYHLTKNEWRGWCKAFDVLPVLDSHDKAKPGAKAAAETDGAKKSKDEDAVERPSTQGRSRYSRPALRIVRELVLSGDAPSVFHARLLARDEKLLAKLGTKQNKDGAVIVRSLEIFTDSTDAKVNVANGMKGLLVSDLGALLRMRKDGATKDTWEDLYIPSQQLDRLAQQSSATREERDAAIRALIGQQNNPIIRHRLDTFWKRLRVLEAMPGADGQPLGEPHRIVIEMVRDDSESSWLGPKAIQEITDAQKKQRDRRENARGRLAEMGQPHGDVLKYLLWEAQGGQCLYGKGETKEGRCVYTNTAIRFTDIAKCRVDHIVPRAMGGPDSFSNKVLTTDETNARKGDRTPYQWFQQDRAAEWDAYRNCVSAREFQLGGMKTRLLLSADAETLVSRYTPLAETAWITRLAQTIAGLHFGWANGNDTTGTKRVVVISGGLTGRVRRKYFLNSLLGGDRTLDGKISSVLDQLTALRTSPLPREQVKEKRWELRDELSELGKQAEKDRSDKRHHALDAMVLSFLEGWVNDPKREEEFRFTALGDAPAFPENRKNEIGILRQRIFALSTAAGDKSKTPEHREELQRQITACHDALASMRQPHDARTIREALRKELQGCEAEGIAPVLPRHLHFEKPKLKAAFYRGVWLRVESESRAARATIENYHEAFEQERVPLAELPFLTNHRTQEKEYSARHGLRRIAEIVEHKDYDKKGVRGGVEGFLQTQPSEQQWREWCASDAAPTLIKPKKGAPDLKELSLYKIEEKRTKRPQETPSTRATLYSIGIGNIEVPDWNSTHFALQISRIIRRPEKGKDSPDIPLEPDADVQAKFLALQSRIEEHYRAYPPDSGERPRKSAALAAWEAQREAGKQAFDQFLRDTGLDRHKVVYLRTDSAKVTDKRYEKAGISSLLTVKTKRFERTRAEKQAQSVSDTWTRFQLRQFLMRDPQPQEWSEFCRLFVQVTRDSFRDFLASTPETAAEFLAYYRGREMSSKKTSLIRTVHQVIGGPDEYVDISKDGSGIYAKGGNRGYLIWKRTSDDETVFGAEPVRGSQKLVDAKKWLLKREGVTLHDAKLWRSGMLLRLPEDTQSGKKLVPADHYYFGSISNGKQATLKPLIGGDIYDGINLSVLLAKGLQRVEEV